MIDTKQPSLFDDEPLPELPPTIAPSHNRDDLRAMIRLIDGEPVIVDEQLSPWLGYSHIHRLRTFVKRHWRELIKRGNLAQIESVSRRRGRPQIAFAFNHPQINYIIIYSGLPDLSELRLLVTDVFTEWQRGNLVSTNAETTIALQDATAAAEEQKPGSVGLGVEMAQINNRFDGVDRRFDQQDTQIAKLRAVVDLTASTVLNGRVDEMRERNQRRTGRPQIVEPRDGFRSPPNPNFGKGGKDA